MSIVTVLRFDDMAGAENMLDNVWTWQDNGLLTVEDAVVVTRTERDELEIQQTHKFGRKYATRGAGAGLLAGLLLGGPIGGLVAGAAIGGVAGAMKKYGLDDRFIREASDGIGIGESALFLLTPSGDLNKLEPELREHKATVLTTTLPEEQERRLREMLRGS